MDPHTTLTCGRNGCDTLAGGFTTPLTLTQASKTYSLGCPGSLAYEYEVKLYEADVNLPRGQWTLSIAQENRSAGIINLPNSVAQGYYMSAFLDNALVEQNNSPKFLSTLLPYLCGGQAQRYSFSAFDSDGDSLVYRFVQPQKGAYTGRVTQCGIDVPGTLSPHFHLNAATGALTTQAAQVQQGRYAMAARVDEYRRVNGRWQQIGWVTRDVTYVAFSSANSSPHFTGLVVSGAPAQPVDQLIRAQPGQTVALTLNASDADAGQRLRFSSDAPGVVPGLSLTTPGANQARLVWQVPADLPPGRYTATVAVMDNGCPNASEEQTLSFLVGAAQPLARRTAQNVNPAAFPTPFREQVQFQAAAGPFIIVDELGRVVAQLSAPADGRVVWRPAAALPAGLYVARSANGRLLARLLRAAN